jgi:hypothetical protein
VKSSDTGRNLENYLSSSEVGPNDWTVLRLI